MNYILVMALALINLSMALPAMSQAETEKKQTPAASKKKSTAKKTAKKEPKSRDMGTHMMDPGKVTAPKQ